MYANMSTHSAECPHEPNTHSLAITCSAHGLSSLLLTLQPKPNLVALARSLTPQAQRYICIGIHLSHQISQPGSSAPDPLVMGLSEDGMRGDREETPDTPDTPRTPDPGPREQGTS